MQGNLKDENTEKTKIELLGKEIPNSFLEIHMPRLIGWGIFYLKCAKNYTLANKKSSHIGTLKFLTFGNVNGNSQSTF